MSISRVTLRDLQEVLAKLDEERAALSTRIADIDTQAAAVRTTHDVVMALYNEAQAEIAASPPPPSKNLRNEMVAILREVNQPMHYKILREQLESRGFTINGANKDNTVGAHLSNDTRFRNVGKGMWALVSWGTDTDRGSESGENQFVDENPQSTPEPMGEQGESPDKSHPSPITPDLTSAPMRRVIYTADLLGVQA